jgi:hypothetical protein
MLPTLPAKLCRMLRSWTAIAGNNCVSIIIVFIIREDLEGVVVPCQTLVHNMGNCWMVFGAVMVLDIVATLGGVAIATLGGVAGTTLGYVGLVGGALGWPDMMGVS